MPTGRVLIMEKIIEINSIKFTWDDTFNIKGRGEVRCVRLIKEHSAQELSSRLINQEWEDRIITSLEMFSGSCKCGQQVGIIVRPKS